MENPRSEVEDELFQVPVLFLIFRRPDTTAKVFEVIRSIRPAQLFIGADGPREGVEDDFERCQETRAIATQVDWPCEVHTLFQDQNLGCRAAPPTAITWFFEHVPAGVILEDDVLPSKDFFYFCQELLERYRDDTRVMAINGSCLPSPRVKQMKDSYFFSNWDYIWGWATWRRAWKHYDLEMGKYEQVLKGNYFYDGYTSLYEEYYWKNSFDRSYYQSESVTWWDHQWVFARRINSGLVVVPKNNMVINLGFGHEATNTHTKRWDFLEFEKMEFPLRHPEIIMQDRLTDDEVFRIYFTDPGTRLRARIRRLMEQVGLGGLRHWLAYHRRRIIKLVKQKRIRREYQRIS